MNWRAMFAIVRKDLKIVVQNKGVLIPIIAVPLIIFGALPWISALAPSMVMIRIASFKEILSGFIQDSGRQIVPFDATWLRVTNPNKLR